MKRFILLLGLCALPLPAFAKVVSYTLNVTQAPVNLSGAKTVDFALAVNGSIPAPTLEFTEGDDAVITVTNNIPTGKDVTIHWHGILLPPEEDGVAYTNTPPVHAGASHTFHFKIRQHGTYWYHSHTGFQEQKGVYGALVIHPQKKRIAYDRDVVAILSDWSDENADQILRNLRKDGDYYLYKKHSVRSYLGALHAEALGTHLKGEWQRMGGMDLSDIGYDAFLTNGKRSTQLADARPGERIRLRIINAGSSTYFRVALGQTPMTVIAADGVDISPVQAKELLMGMAETYDVLFTVPDRKNHELRATAQDITGTTSGWIGAPNGEKVTAPTLPAPNLYAGMSHDMAGMDMSSEDHESDAADETPEVIDSLTVDQLKALAPTTLPKDARVHDVKLVLGGDMRRYIWYVNGKAMFEDHQILVREKDIVRITYVNDTMMHHPMHLHGHFFRVLNDYGAYSPLKHTVDVPPMSTRTIEFYANEPGQWMLHCHNLFHMQTGMARMVRYSTWTPSPTIAAMEHHDPHMGDAWFTYGRIDAATNRAQAYFRASQTWNQVEARVETSNPSGRSFSVHGQWETEGDVFYRRWMGNWLNLVAGGTSYRDQLRATAGVGYTLPFLIDSTLLVNHQGKFRLDAARRFQWTSTIFSDLDASWRPQQGGDHVVDLRLSLMYGPAWAWAAGLLLTNDSLGANLSAQF
ncbi:MAG: multicopper oxidase domain-containing protein [Bdellovibrionales bacterium]|nr:multicopper oxidase domain-containing protein [Bdellovibrionales bacterium]